MRRLLSILGCILLGGIAASSGMGVYLAKANDDRERLAALAAEAQNQARRAEEQSRQAVIAANKRIASADSEIAQAQSKLKLMEEERDLLSRATPLNPPSSKLTKGWKEAVNLSLGISISYPKETEIESNDGQGLTLTKTGANVQADPADLRWLSITPFDGRLESELVSNLASSTAASYMLNGHLLIGRKGQYAGKSGTFTVLRVRYQGTATHLIWIREPSANPRAPLTQDILATLDFSP